ncbi:MAG: VCBS repeat-containing protein [Aquirufa sp.]
MANVVSVLFFSYFYKNFTKAFMNIKSTLASIFTISSILIFISCQSEENTLFTELDPAETGIQFSNRITENDTMNILTFEYVYNGGGVALGDFNNDNKVDIYFTGNQVENKLYLNQGVGKNNQLNFKDVTNESHTNGEGQWNSGVTLVDINNDNLLDIYVCSTVKKVAKERANILYVNQGIDKNGIPSFKNLAEEYGIADTTHSTNANFFDYDNDGDLDLYVIVDEMADIHYPNMYHPKIIDGSSRLTDRLYRNDYDPKTKHAHFKDVSKEEGILIEGFGLGVNITDINQDGWKDIYVTNDYLSNDLLYINQHKNGKHTGFQDQAPSYFKHTSHSAMGNDVNDINNDGLVDIIAVDMMAADNYRKKMLTMANNYQTYQNNDKYGYTFQFPRNTLQLNRGKDPKTGIPAFSEIGLFAGVAETDWSWTPMVTDFDNDGLRDIIITNGFPKDITEQDFMVYRAEKGNFAEPQFLLDMISSVKIPNFAFKNNGNLGFDDVSKKWGIKKPSFSNGAAYADLDNDGDLDYVVNNIDDSASVYRNNAIQIAPEKSHFLRVKLKGSGQNMQGLGATLEIKYGKDQKQFYEYNPYRGYLSTVESIAHFGLGDIQKINELKVNWPNGKTQIMRNIPSNQLITLEEKNAQFVQKTEKATNTLFTDISEQLNIPYVHIEDDIIDFNNQKLLPHKFSQQGPCLAVGDINGDQLEDVFIGGSTRHSGQFLIQDKSGKFHSKDLVKIENGYSKTQEDMGSLLFDIENDGDLDLYLVSGSNELPLMDPGYQDRIYLNDGKGNFTENKTILPAFTKSGSCVKATDFDHDGDLDLFIGNRVEPGFYPKPVSSYILRNESPRLKFTDVTAKVAPELSNIGLICDAIWSDFDNDGWQDLILAGEWMPIQMFKNKGGKLTSITKETGIEHKMGWWNSITAGDFDNDGDMDYVAGNLGQNTLHRASDKTPAKIYSADFNGDGTYDAIPTIFFKDQEGNKKEYPFNTRDDLTKQFIQTRKRFDTFAKYAVASISDVLTAEELKKAMILEANWMNSSYIENMGGGKFRIFALPRLAQIAPVLAIQVQDFDEDGNLDMVISGNDYGNEISTGRLDASKGLLLKGNGQGKFREIALTKSGINMDGDSKALVKIKSSNGALLLMNSQNLGKLKTYQLNKSVKDILINNNEFSALLTLKNGKKRKEEFPMGTTYMSQNGQRLWLNSSISNIKITNQKQQITRTIAN